MTRPVDPSWTVGTWATNANHAAGANAWNGQPTKVVPPSVAAGFVPGQGNAAEYHNYLLNQLFATQASEKTYLQNLIDFAGDIPIRNWPYNVTSLDDLRYAFFDPYARVWWAVGEAKNARKSSDQGATWSGSSELSGVGAGSEDLDGGDADGEGNVVIASLTRYGFAVSAGSSSRVDIHGATATGTGRNGRVVYDPVNELWCAVTAIGGGTEVFVATSAAPASTWTARTKPTNMADGAIAMAVDKTAGRIVLANHTRGGNLLYVSYSDDGGITWSSPTSLAHLLTSGTPAQPKLSLSYNADTGVWMLVTAELVGTPTSAIYTSTDGASWTAMVRLNATCLKGPAPYGGVWVAGAALDSGGGVNHLAVSRDDGATWHFLGMRLTGTEPQGVYAGDGGLIALTESNALASLRAGDPGLASLP